MPLLLSSIILLEVRTQQQSDLECLLIGEIRRCGVDPMKEKRKQTSEQVFCYFACSDVHVNYKTIKFNNFEEMVINARLFAQPRKCKIVNEKPLKNMSRWLLKPFSTYRHND